MKSIEYCLDGIIQVLKLYHPQNTSNACNKRTASVAMILRECVGITEMLFIERAADARDPWSGHLAFPGGKIEPGEDSRQAAERETEEEIGISLSQSTYLGRLSDIVGTNLPVQVSCHVYAITSCCLPVINNEVHDLFWVPLYEIYNQNRHCHSVVNFDESTLEVPSIRLPQHGKPVLWGITYRLVMQLQEIMNSRMNHDCKSKNKRYTRYHRISQD